MAPIYLDNNATTRVAPEVFEAMLPYLTDAYGNPSSVHQIGARAAAALKEARERAAAFLHCRETEIIFTSCGTESNNTAIRGVLDAAPGRRHIVVTAVEHPSVLELCTHLEGEGYTVTRVGVDREGRLDLAELADAITDETAVVSVMWANNETGVISPMNDVVDIVKARGIPLHVDAVQACGKIPIDLSRTEVDLLAISGHKFHAPKGVGVLYVRRATRMRPLLIGGGQEKGRRSGTENIPYIAGLGKAFELAEEYLAKDVEKTRQLRDRFEREIFAHVPCATRIGTQDSRLANTSCLSFVGLEGEAILLLLDEVGICASSGSACTTGALEPSHVLKAMGASTEVAHGSIRFSLGRYTTAEEIDRVIDELPPIIQRLSEISASKKAQS